MEFRFPAVRLPATRRPPIGAVLAPLGIPRPVRRLASSPRSRVWLVEFDASPAIVKQIVGGADAGRRYEREVVALRLAARARPAVVPELLATDPAQRVLVLEYLTGAEYIAGGIPAARWAVGYAESLARLHASTTAADAGTLPAWRGPDVADVAAFLHLATHLAVPVPPQAPEELHALVRRLAPAGQHALLHGDPCPGAVDAALREADHPAFPGSRASGEDRSAAHWGVRSDPVRRDRGRALPRRRRTSAGRCSREHRPSTVGR
jgi:hypothetical protein